MAQTVVVKQDTLESILATLRKLEKEVTEVKMKLAAGPQYGSREWWEWSTERGIREIRDKKYTTFKSVDAYMKDVQKRTS